MRHRCKLCNKLADCKKYTLLGVSIWVCPNCDGENKYTIFDYFVHNVILPDIQKMKREYHKNVHDITGIWDKFESPINTSGWVNAKTDIDKK